MATAVTAALVTPGTTMFTTPAHVKGIPTSVTIDNQGLAARTIFLEDDFTTDATAALPATAETVAKGQWTVAAGLVVVLDLLDLKDKEFLGDCQCYADVAEPLCIIAIDYHFE